MDKGGLFLTVLAYRVNVYHMVQTKGHFVDAAATA